MGFTDQILFNYFKWRQKKIEKVIDNPMSFQRQLLKEIMSYNSESEYGRINDFRSIKNYDTFRKNIPIKRYEDIFSFIEKMMDGEPNVLCHDKINWFAKSSGTSNARSKFIPVSKNYLKKGHLKCAWDAASFIYNEDSTAKLFADKSLIMGGSIEPISAEMYSGDISAIILHHFPKIGRRFYTPDFETALMKKWDDKIEKMATITAQQNVTLLAGVPTWTIVLLKKILEITGKDNISEVWPNLKSFLHGGVGFGPYKKTFQKLIPSTKVSYREVYNASEGYFAIQNYKDEDGMLLLCDHGIFYEFIPEDKIEEEQPDCLSIQEVELGKNYALVITNISGLYRYRIGDMIKVVSVLPLKIKVVGREKENINVFGEEVSVSNTDTALAETCLNENVRIVQYTVVPVFMTNERKGGHEWFIEFEEPPNDLTTFAKLLDGKLRELNSDYDAKRSYDLAMNNLLITSLPLGSFEKWMRKNNKYGGQNKVPRLHNSRTIAEALIQINNA